MQNQVSPKTQRRWAIQHAAVRQAVATVIRDRRERAGMLQKHLAAALDIHLVSECNRESAGRGVDIAEIFRYAEVLGTTPMKLFAEICEAVKEAE